MKGDGRGPGPRSRSPMPILFSESRTKLGPAMAESEGTWVGEGTADRRGRKRFSWVTTPFSFHRMPPGSHLYHSRGAVALLSESGVGLQTCLDSHWWG